jgi:hypothetical protein
VDAGGLEHDKGMIQWVTVFHLRPDPLYTR